MSSDVEYLKNYSPDTLYINPSAQGTYVSVVAENEELIGEFEVTPRSRIAVKAFYVNGKKDFNTFKIIKMKYHKIHGWNEDESITVNRFDLSNILAFSSIISTLDFSDSKKTKINLGAIGIEQLQSLLASSSAPEIIHNLSNSPNLDRDIYALASKKKALAQFKANLNQPLTESEWQNFFETNPWIFGHGLQHVFLNKVSKKLETTTTGSAFDQNGKRVDGLLHTKAVISQYVLVEIKRADTELLKESAYRSGCWSASSELSDAVTQVQKTTFDFAKNRFHDRLKDEFGNEIGQSIYAVQPRSYLVIGNTKELLGNDDKVACFELYRRNISAPEIIAFDELYHRAKFIVENLSDYKSLNP